MEFERSFEEDVKIDRNNLEKEAGEYPSILWYWSDQLARAKNEKEELDVKLKYEEGKHEIKLRTDGLGSVKVTEAAISAYMAADPTLMTLRSALVEVKKTINTLYAVNIAIEAKKSKIEDLRHLWIANFYSAPKTENAGDQLRKQLNKE